MLSYLYTRYAIRNRRNIDEGRMIDIQIRFEISRIIDTILAIGGTFSASYVLSGSALLALPAAALGAFGYFRFVTALAATVEIEMFHPEEERNAEVIEHVYALERDRQLSTSLTNALDDLYNILPDGADRNELMDFIDPATLTAPRRPVLIRGDSRIRFFESRTLSAFAATRGARVNPITKLPYNQEDIIEASEQFNTQAQALVTRLTLSS